MKILAINSSPRHEGNTAILLNEVLKSAKKEARGEEIETEFINIGASGIKPCRACGACRKMQNKKCVINDDVFNEIFAKMVEADALVFGSPTYFSGMTPELKSLIDRSGYVARGNGMLFRRKLGAAVIAQRRGGATSVLESINFMFLMSEMFVVGSTYWNFGTGGEKGDVANDKEALENMENLGQNIAWLLKKIYTRPA